MMEHGRVGLIFKNGRIDTFLEVFHILRLARNLIAVSKMSNASMQVITARWFKE